MGTPSITRAAAAVRSGLVVTLLTGLSVVPAVVGAQVSVRGVLYDDVTGAPVRGTVMLVDPATNGPVVHTVSDSLGQFELKSATGTYQIAAVRAGYTSVLSAPVPLANGDAMTIRLPIAQTGDPQHRISVVSHFRSANLGQRSPDEHSGFESRRVQGTGLQYDRAQLARSNATTLGQFLENVPGFSVGDPGSTSSMEMTRSAGWVGNASSPLLVSCHVGWFLDGHRMDLPGAVDAMTDGLGSMSMESIDAVEVFRGISEMPAQFAQSDLRCGAVAIWTRGS